MDGRKTSNTELYHIINRLHYYHHGKSNMFTGAKDIWFPYTHKNIALMAENCRKCTAAEKNLKTMCSKRDLGSTPEPKEPNGSLLLDFRGPKDVKFFATARG